MSLTKTERLMLSNQNRILAALNPERSDDYIYKAEIIERGYEGLYDDVFENIHDGIPLDVCNETHEILTMYRVINNLIDGLSDEDAATVPLQRLEFEGFDANNDPHYYFMRFIVDRSGLYEEYAGRNLNSHSVASLRKYRRMLRAYHEALEQNNHILTFEGLRSIAATL